MPMVRFGCLVTVSRIKQNKLPYRYDAACELLDINLQRCPHAIKTAFKSLLTNWNTLSLLLLIILHPKHDNGKRKCGRRS